MLNDWYSRGFLMLINANLQNNFHEISINFPHWVIRQKRISSRFREKNFLAEYSYHNRYTNTSVATNSSSYDDFFSFPWEDEENTN